MAEAPKDQGGASATAATEQVVTVREFNAGKYTQSIRIGDRHTIIADEPEALGGNDNGPNPYDLLLASLGACTAMTLRMYAGRKGLPLEKIGVTLRHDKIHADDCAECETKEGKIDRIIRVITLDGPLNEDQRRRLLEIADKCPVHRTLMGEIHIVSRLSD